MVEFEHPRVNKLAQEFTSPRVNSLRNDEYTKLKRFPQKDSDSIMDKIVMAQSFLAVSDTSNRVRDFVAEAFFVPLEEKENIVPYAYHTVFESYNHKDEKKQVHVLNTVEVCIADSATTQMIRTGVGFIDMQKFGGFMVEGENNEIPTDDYVFNQILIHHVDLPFAPHGILPLAKEHLIDVEEHASVFLEEAYETYWSHLHVRSSTEIFHFQ